VRKWWWILPLQLLGRAWLRQDCPRRPLRAWVRFLKFFTRKGGFAHEIIRCPPTAEALLYGMLVRFIRLDADVFKQRAEVLSSTATSAQDASVKEGRALVPKVIVIEHEVQKSGDIGRQSSMQ
jgi:hypothetical protein